MILRRGNIGMTALSHVRASGLATTIAAAVQEIGTFLIIILLEKAGSLIKLPFYRYFHFFRATRSGPIYHGQFLRLKCFIRKLLLLTGGGTQ